MTKYFVYDKDFEEFEIYDNLKDAENRMSLIQKEIEDEGIDENIVVYYGKLFGEIKGARVVKYWTGKKSKKRWQVKT